MYAMIILYQSGNIYLAGFTSSMTEFFNSYTKNVKGTVIDRTEDSIIVKTDAGPLSSVMTVKGIFLDNISSLYIPISKEDLEKLMKGKN